MNSAQSCEPVPQKLVIENFVKVLPPDDADEDLKKLIQGIGAIQAMESITISEEELHNSVENIHSKGKSNTLYSFLQYMIEAHVKKNLRPILEDNKDKESCLMILDDIWTRFRHEMVQIQNMLKHLDENYIPEACVLLSVWDLGIYLFDTYVMSCLDKKAFIDALKNLIEEEKKGERPDQGLSKKLFSMLSDLFWRDVLMHFESTDRTPVEDDTSEIKGSELIE